MRRKLTAKWILMLALVAGFALNNYAQYALSFGGGGDYVELGGTDFAPPWTVEARVNKSEETNYQHLLTGNDGNSGIRIEQWWGTKIGYTHSGVADYTFNNSLPTNQWKHVALVCDGSSVTLYIDGVEKQTIDNVINMPMQRISKNEESGSMNSVIDELRIYNTALSQSTIDQYKDVEIDETHENWDQLVSYYQFNEGTGNTCYDSKGSYDGTIFGATWFNPDINWDAGIASVEAPSYTSGVYSHNEPLLLKLKNFGNNTINVDFEVSYTLNGGAPVIHTVPASSNSLTTGEVYMVDFGLIDMSVPGDYEFEFDVNLPDDENPENDVLIQTYSNTAQILGDVSSFESDENEFLFTSGSSKVKVIFYADDIFRIWLAPNGTFTNPAGDQIVVGFDYPAFEIQWSEEDEYYRMETQECVLRAYKSPLKFALYDADENVIWEEVQPLAHGAGKAYQSLTRKENEYYYGGGMHIGAFSHRNQRLRIEKYIPNYGDWNLEGTVPNPAPFFMSTEGFGAFRNTFAPGIYDFKETVDLIHDESRFDSYYFVGESMKDVLDGYTQITGRPYMPPRWGLEFGDADCYNDAGQTTPDVIGLIAEKYREHDMPGGWILPNDGYGCGYTELDYVVDELDDLGFYTGLWTEEGVSTAPYEVGDAGTRGYKLDVAWVGSGYSFALNACKTAVEAIEDNSDDRSFVWSVCGWAGTQRYSTIWNGDQAGDWNNIKINIATMVGSGLSGHNLASGDVDGIFGGSSITYTRDLQWKCFLPNLMVISGWSNYQKQPWAYSANYRDVNRKYLKLRQRLIPYIYSYCWESNQTGVPMTRAMVLEFPEDPITWGTDTEYQFMAGEWFLVAPVYASGSTRSDIYLPEGPWFDYWDGTLFEGGQTIESYNAPMEKLPLFVKAGAIIPMYPEALHDREKEKDTLTLDIYPYGETSFDLYEDDGVSKLYRVGEYATTHFAVSGMYNGTQDITVNIGECDGYYDGKYESRAYWLNVHSTNKPDSVFIKDNLMTEHASMDALHQASQGWYYDATDRNGMVYVKVPFHTTSIDFDVHIRYPDDVGINQVYEGIRVYPNPASTCLNVDFENGCSDKTRIELFSVNGIKLLSMKAEAMSKKHIVKLENITSGTYLLKVFDNERSSTKKVEVM